VIDRHRGVPAFVAVHGPSLVPVRDNILALQSRGRALRFSANEWWQFFPTPPDYWVAANNVLRIEHIAPVVRAHPSVRAVMFADTVDLTPYDSVDALLSCDYVGYDQRHFNSSPCTPRGACCDRLVPGRETLQEVLQAVAGTDRHYGTGHTVAVHMIAFAILMGCSPIYVAGLDLDYRLGYAYGRPSPADTFWDNHRGELEFDLGVLKASADRLGLRLVTLNRNAWYKSLPKGTIDIGEEAG